jgi:8-oxo-dGTP pyrophosphatase MutT (NUDIX family)
MSGARREALLRALDAYHGDGPGDEEAVSRFRTFLARDDPFCREDAEGHVTASAVVAHASGDPRFLLVFHRKLDRWLQPGGHVEPGDETVFDTALREALEETGLKDFASPIQDAILDLDVHPIPAFGDEAAHLHYDVRFLLTTEGRGMLAFDAAWFAEDQIAPADRDGSLFRAVRKAIERLAQR